jgi:hypothetical protein
MVYEQPIYPANLYADRSPHDHESYAREVNRPQVEKMHERDIWVRPARIAGAGEDDGGGDATG